MAAAQAPGAPPAPSAADPSRGKHVRLRSDRGRPACRRFEHRRQPSQASRDGIAKGVRTCACDTTPRCGLSSRARGALDVRGMPLVRSCRLARPRRGSSQQDQRRGIPVHSGVSGRRRIRRRRWLTIREAIPRMPLTGLVARSRTPSTRQSAECGLARRHLGLIWSSPCRSGRQHDGRRWPTEGRRADDQPARSSASPRAGRRREQVLPWSPESSPSGSGELPD